MQTKTPPQIINQLTPEEIVRIFAKYPLCPTAIVDVNRGKMFYVPDYLQGVNFENNQITCECTNFEPHYIKLVLTQLRHLTDNDIFMACYACHSASFIKGEFVNWVIKREFDLVRVENVHFKKDSFHLNLDNGNVHLFLDGRHSTLGTPAYSLEYFYQQNYAIPVYFGPKHPANGKTPLELGIAVPTRRPIVEVLSKQGLSPEDIIQWFNDKRLLDINLLDINIYNEVYAGLINPDKKLS